MSKKNTNKDPLDRHPMLEQLSQLWRNKTAIAGLVIIVIFILVAIFAPYISPHDPLETSLYDQLKPPVWYQGGTVKNLLGTDDLGRDILSRLIYGARISLLVSVISVSLAFFFGTLIYLGPSLENAMIAIGITYVPRFARIVRGSVLEECEKDYVVAARAIGANEFRIIFLSILPNCMGPLIVQTTLNFASAILDAAALSFLGLGAQPPTPEWGAMIAQSRSLILRASWVMTLPGLAILFAVLGFNLLGDGLRDALDPRLRD